MLKNIREAPASKIIWSSRMVETALNDKEVYSVHRYHVNVVTELFEHETLNLTAVSIENAKELARDLVSKGLIGLGGHICVKISL